MKLPPDHLLHRIWRFRERYRSVPSSLLVKLAVLIAVPAFLFSLGAMTFIGDEAIRSQVALEMQLSGNYLVPTLYGEPYYNKPPLYNWLIAAWSNLWGGYGEWPARSLTLVFLGCFAGTVFHFTRRNIDTLTAWSAVLMLITSGRILIWDSLLGLIDICFSWVIYLNFMVLYSLGRKSRWGAMLVWSYLLAAAAFLLKGLPAVVFQVLSVGTTLYFFGVFRMLILSRRHIAGILAGAVPVLAYYALYSREMSLAAAFSTLFDQSMQRTATHYGWWSTLMHLFSFPIEQIYHFLPWSLLVVCLFQRRIATLVREHPFVWFQCGMLLVNLPVYWSSVEVYPRYLLMFVPLFNAIGYYAWQRMPEGKWNARRFLQIAFAGIAGAAALVFWAIPLVDRARELPWWIPAYLGCSLLITFALPGIIWDEKRAVIWLSIVLLTVRIGLDAFILPHRKSEDRAHYTRDDASRLATTWGHRDWYVYGQTETHRVAGFYLTRAVNRIIYTTHEAADTSALYLVDPALYPRFEGKAVDSIRLENGYVLPLMQAGKP